MKDDVRRRRPQPRQISALAVIGAKTSLGGTITSASSGIEINGLRVAMVGDTVSHPDLGDAVITTGLKGIRHRGYPLAWSGSLTSRTGEFVTDSLQYHAVAIEYDDGHVEFCSLRSDASDADRD